MARAVRPPTDHLSSSDFGAIGANFQPQGANVQPQVRGERGVARAPARRTRVHPYSPLSPPSLARASPSPPSATTTSPRAWSSAPSARYGQLCAGTEAEGVGARRRARPPPPALPHPQLIAPTHISYTPKKETVGGVAMDLSDADGQAKAAALAAEGWGAKKG